MSNGNLDDQYTELMNFRQALIAFNSILQDSVRDLEQRHEAVSPLWTDENRRRYDAQWDSFRQMVKHYVKVEGPSYVEFISIKIHKLERYLRGG